jgi:hypothetical protein
MIKTSGNIDKAFRKLTSEAWENVQKKRGILIETVLNPVADEIIKPNKVKPASQISDPGHPYNIFLKGVKIHKKAEGKEIWMHLYGNDIYVFIGSEEEVLDKIKNATDEQKTLTILTS